MLVAQSRIQTPRPQRQFVLGKNGDVLLFHLVVALGNDVLLVEVVSVALCGRGLRTASQRALPHGIGQHQLACCHPSVFVVERGDGTVAELFAKLLLVKMVLRLATQQCGVQVDAQLSRLSHVVGVQLPHGPVGLADVCFQPHVAIEGTVLHVSLLHFCLETVVENGLRREAQAHGVGGAEVVAHPSLVVKLRPAAPYRQLSPAEELVFPDVQLLVYVLVEAGVTVVEGDIGKHLEPSSAVSQGEVVVVVPFVVLRGLTHGLQAQPVALWLQRLDADHGVHLGIVSRSGCGDDVHALHVSRLQLPELAGVAYLLVVDVDLRLALGHHGVLPIGALHQRQHREQVGGRAYVVEDGVLHVDSHAAMRHLVLRNLAFHRDAVQGIGLRLQRDGADVACTHLARRGLVADVRHLQHDASFVARYHKIAVLIAHTAIDEGARCLSGSCL